MLLKEKMHQILGSYAGGAKRSVFLACTVHLVEQQKEYLAKFMPPEVKVEAFVGARGVDYWSDAVWQRELEACNVRTRSLRPPPTLAVFLLPQAQVD
jgi:hypothetical protein